MFYTSDPCYCKDLLLLTALNKHSVTFNASLLHAFIVNRIENAHTLKLTVYIVCLTHFSIKYNAYIYYLIFTITAHTIA